MPLIPPSMDPLFAMLVPRQDDAAVPDPPTADPVPAHPANPVLAFIIGLAIVTLASVLNAAGLNLTKLDHVRTSAIPKSARRKDWLRPLWLLGMLLYILSQLIGSTLALQYMRAEYVAPLGSTSLIFNFLFARFLVGTPVTMNDVYGTVIVVIGVIGIVAFGSINTGLSSETSAAHLATLWSRGGWIAYFIVMSLALTLLYIFTSQLELVLNSRSDLSAEPFAGMSARMKPAGGTGFFKRVRRWMRWSMVWVAEWLEAWTAGKDDKVIAWTLGIGWACGGGGLAGECLVFAKATVQLISGSLSHENPGNQLGHLAPIFTLIFLAITAVMQIICLNRGLKVYDSTLVVPVFYGVYTATGWLNSLIFNNATDAFASWTLFLIFVSILILISGVVLLTHKKPEVVAAQRDGVTLSAAPPRSAAAAARKANGKDGAEDEREGLRDEGERAGDGEVVWDVGDASDDEEQDGAKDVPEAAKLGVSALGQHSGEEGVRLMDAHEEHDHEEHEEQPPLSTTGLRVAPPVQSRRRSSSSVHRPRHSDVDADEFGAFEGGR